MPLETELLRTFVAAVDTGSFTRAGDLVNRSQSAVSMQIKRLEAEVGDALFLRDARKVRLTAKGETLLPYARRMLSVEDEALAELSGPGLSGTLRLGAPEGVAEWLLPGALKAFARKHPNVRMDVWSHTSDRLIGMVDTGELDLAVCSSDLALGESLYSRRLVWVVAADSDVHLQDPLPLAVFHERCVYRHAAVQALEQCGRRYRVAFAGNGLSGQLASVRAGLAVAPAAEPERPADCRVVGESEGLPPLPEARVSMHIRSHPTRAVSALADCLRTHARNL